MGIMDKKMETTIMGYIGGIVCWDNGQENRNYYNGLYRGIVCWGYNMGIMDKKMETTIMGYIGV